MRESSEGRCPGNCQLTSRRLRAHSPTLRFVTIAFRPLRLQRALGALLLAGTGALYLFGLNRNGWGNSFYAAAAQAGSQSWTAMFFGSSDAGNSITVDKPPAALWVMGLSVRLFGLSSWSLLVPQALMGVAAVALLAATVRRVLGPWAGLLAGLLLAVTPVVTLMFRYDNPDALMTLLLVAAAWATTRAVEDGRTRWMVLTGALVGVAFLTKSLQAFLVLPALAAVILRASPGSLRRRLGQLAAGGGAMIAAAGWWFVAVTLVPAGDRPWVGGSSTDSPLDLALGYNGLGRLAGEQSPSGRVTVNGGSVWRLFGSAGDQVGWLLPAAAIGVLVGWWAVRGRPRTDPLAAAVLLWGGWAVVTAVVLSLMRGISHPYYSVELAPAVAALVALGATLLWRRRTAEAYLALGVVTVFTTVWSMSLVERRLPPGSVVEIAVAVLGLAAVAGLLVAAFTSDGVRGRRLVGGLTVLAALAGPLAWSVSTATMPHGGSAVTAGPQGEQLIGRAPQATAPAAPAALSLLRDDTDDWTWNAATIGHRAADLQLATGAPVMPIGGFAGSDPAPTLAGFEADVYAHRLHWYVPSRSGSGDARRIDAWVREHGRPVGTGSAELYDLSAVSPRG
jgi:4-amino-4-deoxy-L-arabinose transferase-like glycosyltransferase